MSLFYNLTDLLDLDWLELDLITPQFLINSGLREKKDIRTRESQFQGFRVRMIFSLIAGGIIAGLVYFL